MELHWAATCTVRAELLVARRMPPASNPRGTVTRSLHSMSLCRSICLLPQYPLPSRASHDHDRLASYSWYYLLLLVASVARAASPPPRFHYSLYPPQIRASVSDQSRSITLKWANEPPVHLCNISLLIEKLSIVLCRSVRSTLHDERTHIVLSIPAARRR